MNEQALQDQDEKEIEDTEEIETGAPEIAVADGADGDDQTDPVETEARSQGWVPKDEFRGDPDTWRDAETFVKRGKEIAAISSKRVKFLEQRLEQQESEFEKRIARLDNANQKALKRDRERIEREYEQQLRAAAELGDLERFDQITDRKRQEIDQFEDELSAGPAVTDTNTQGFQERRIQEWAQQYPALVSDKIMQTNATMLAGQIQQENPGWSLDDILDETADQLKQVFPDKFGGRKRARTTQVDSGTRTTTSAARKKDPVSTLPPEAKAAGQRFVDEGLYKDLAEYAKVYHAS